MTGALGLRRCGIGETIQATAGSCAPTGRSFLVGAPQLVPCRLHALFAPMAAPIFAAKTLFLRSRGEDLAPLSVLEDDLVAAGKDLKRLVDLLQLIEPHRAGLVKDFEVGRIDKVRHWNAVDC